MAVRAENGRYAGDHREGWIETRHVDAKRERLDHAFSHAGKSFWRTAGGHGCTGRRDRRAGRERAFALPSDSAPDSPFRQEEHSRGGRTDPRLLLFIRSNVSEWL